MTYFQAVHGSTLASFIAILWFFLFQPPLAISQNNDVPVMTGLRNRVSHSYFVLFFGGGFQWFSWLIPRYTKRLQSYSGNTFSPKDVHRGLSNKVERRHLLSNFKKLSIYWIDLLDGKSAFSHWKKFFFEPKKTFSFYNLIDRVKIWLNNCHYYRKFNADHEYIPHNMAYHIIMGLKQILPTLISRSA